MKICAPYNKLSWRGFLPQIQTMLKGGRNFDNRPSQPTGTHINGIRVVTMILMITNRLWIWSTSSRHSSSLPKCRPIRIEIITVQCKPSTSFVVNPSFISHYRLSSIMRNPNNLKPICFKVSGNQHRWGHRPSINYLPSFIHHPCMIYCHHASDVLLLSPSSETLPASFRVGGGKQ